MSQQNTIVQTEKKRIGNRNKKRFKISLRNSNKILPLSIHIILCITLRQHIRMLYCVRACARDTGDVIWQYMAVNSQRSVSAHMCDVLVAFNLRLTVIIDVPLAS